MIFNQNIDCFVQKKPRLIGFNEKNGPKFINIPKKSTIFAPNLLNLC